MGYLPWGPQFILGPSPKMFTKINPHNGVTAVLGGLYSAIFTVGVPFREHVLYPLICALMTKFSYDLCMILWKKVKAKYAYSHHGTAKNRKNYSGSKARESSPDHSKKHGHTDT